MFYGNLLFFLVIVSSCLAAPPKLAFPSLGDSFKDVPIPISEDDKQKAINIKESFLDKHQQFLGLLNFDFFNTKAETSQITPTEVEGVEKSRGGSGEGRQGQSAMIQAHSLCSGATCNLHTFPSA